MKRYVSAGRLDNISNWKARTDAKNAADATAKEMKLAGMIDRVRALKPRIQELLETANAAREAGIALGKTSCYQKGSDPDVFESEGICHRVGFIKRGAVSGNGTRLEPDYAYIGIDNGGANGKYDFITDGVFVGGVYEERPHNRVTDYPDFEYDLNKFLNGFDAFETRFYKYIDDLTGGEE